MILFSSFHCFFSGKTVRKPAPVGFFSFFHFL